MKNRIYYSDGKCFADKKQRRDLAANCLDCPRTIQIRDFHKYLTETPNLPEPYLRQSAQ